MSTPTRNLRTPDGVAAPVGIDRLADELAELLAEALVADLQHDAEAGTRADEERAG